MNSLFVLSPEAIIGEQADQPLLAKRINEGSLDSGITLLLRRRSTKLSTLTHIPVLWPLFTLKYVLSGRLTEIYIILSSSQLKIPVNNKIACSLVCFILLWRERKEEAGLGLGLCLAGIWRLFQTQLDCLEVTMDEDGFFGGHCLQ